MENRSVVARGGGRIWLHKEEQQKGIGDAMEVTYILIVEVAKTKYVSIKLRPSQPKISCHCI